LVISPSSYNRRVGLAVCCPVTSGMRRMTGYSRGARLGPDDEPPRGLPPGRPVTEGGVYDSAR
jgi:mRNA-degrading endonuclease toxin of MazEF toxin-antitoxin module